jgi:hydrogenase 3 maturation protease
MKLQAWQRKILQTLDELEKERGPLRIVFLGVGNDLYGDDAIGVEIARTLLNDGIGDWKDRMIIVGGPAPESFCGVIRRFKPDLVMLIDAAAMDLPAGTVRWLPWADELDDSLLSWTIPLHLMVSYLRVETGCEVGLIGIQPQDVRWGEASQLMARQVECVGKQIECVIHQHERSHALSAHPTHGNCRKRIQHGSQNPIEIQPC